MKQMSDLSFELLTMAIVQQATFDYVTATDKIAHGNHMCRGYLNYDNQFKDCIKFFNSKWFNELTNLDGKQVLANINEHKLELLRRKKSLKGLNVEFKIRNLQKELA